MKGVGERVRSYDRRSVGKSDSKLGVETFKKWWGDLWRLIRCSVRYVFSGEVFLGRSEGGWC